MNAEQARKLFLENCQPGDRGALERYGENAAIDAILKLTAFIESDARRYASHYQPDSDGRNTFLMLSDAIENLDADRVTRHWEDAHEG